MNGEKVRVTEAIIQQNNQNITDILNVTAGVPIILTCLTRISRPPATIVWFLGSQTKGSGSIWNYTPSPADHNGKFYCQVYNTDQNKKIDSNKARLYVRVHIDSVMLRNGTALTLNEGQLAVLICETGACRPSAAIYWMKNGANITDSPTDVTVIIQANYFFISIGTLHYTGKREENGKSLACGALNGLDSGQTSGILIVTIYFGAGIVNLSVNDNNTVSENSSAIFQCHVDSNPPSTITWMKESNSALLKTESKSKSIQN